MSLKLLNLPDKIAILQHRGLPPSPPPLQELRPCVKLLKKSTYKLVVLSIRVKMVQLTKERANSFNCVKLYATVQSTCTKFYELCLRTHGFSIQGV